MASPDNLRRRLEETTEAQDESQYLAMVAAVARDFPNTLVLIDSPYPIQRYTCVMHIFEFTGKPEYEAIAKRGFNVVFAGPTFVQWLLEKEFLTEVAEQEARDGDLIVYSDDYGRVKHAGLIRPSRRVESKWGKGGLFEHGVFEVPVSYGDNARFFRKIPFEDALKHFKCFAEERGLH